MLSLSELLLIIYLESILCPFHVYKKGWKNCTEWTYREWMNEEILGTPLNITQYILIALQIVLTLKLACFKIPFKYNFRFCFRHLMSIIKTLQFLTSLTFWLFLGLKFSEKVRTKKKLALILYDHHVYWRSDYFPRNHSRGKTWPDWTCRTSLTWRISQ